MTPSNEKPQPFSQFMLSEYTNLAQAFFSAGVSLTNFFQYYLLALGVPLTAAGIALKITGETKGLSFLLTSQVATVLGAIFLVIGGVGLCMGAYIMNLRIDALLYARSVNGIRGYFYSLPSSDSNVEQYRTLPTDRTKPNYLEPWPFLWPVVIAFALLNSTYIGIGLTLLALPFRWILTCTTAFVLVHGLLYLAVTQAREKIDAAHRALASPEKATGVVG